MLALITRPEEDSAGLEAELAARGIRSLLQPMLEIAPVAGVDVDLAGVQALLATSANGVRALAAASIERALPLLAVGDATARTALALGFQNVESASGDVESLASLAIRRLQPESGALLHVAAGQVAGDLAGRLSAAGFVLRRVVLYEARAVTALRPIVEDALREGGIGLALFFSPRTAATFVTVAQAAGLGTSCGRIDAYCLSRAVASALAILPWRSVRIAAKPDQAALLACIMTNHVPFGSQI